MPASRDGPAGGRPPGRGRPDWHITVTPRLQLRAQPGGST